MPLCRRPISIDHTKVLNSDQKDVPVLIVLGTPDSKPIAEAGDVARSGGDDLFFTLADGETVLSHEVIACGPESGSLKAWVRIPELSCDEDTELFVYYGDPEEQTGGQVWDSNYKLVHHLNGADPKTELPHSDGLNISDRITVQAWVHSDVHRSEAMQPLVSKWELLSSFDTFNGYDAGNTDGLACVGFYGAVFDGRHVYFCPIRTTRSDRLSVHANVLRYDTQGDFQDSKSYEACDASHTDGMRTVCYYGATFDGRYVIFTPRDTGDGYHSRVLRYDTHMDFKQDASWSAHDANLAHSHQSAVFDGRYVYFCPGYTDTPDGAISESEFSGKVLRLDTKADFKDTASYSLFDAKTLSPEAACYDGGAFDGRFIYFVPLATGTVLRYDTASDFQNRDSWRCYAAGPLGMQANVGAVFDGRHLYFVAYCHGLMVRYDTEGDFETDASWETYDAGRTSGLDTGGFDGGFFDGRYVYFVPWTRQDTEGDVVYHCNWLRYDTRQAFDDPESWEGYDAGHTDNLSTVGYNAGAFDGRYFYSAPLYDGDGDQFHGKILRYDTLGTNGAFSLRYCDYGHNGGLCAAVPGPSFLVNTENGVVGIAAHRTLAPGWHHLAGVYNGRTIKLFVDGMLVGERSGTGAIQTNAASVSLGHISNGSARFKGVVDHVRISDIARSDDRIKTEYQNLANPSGFIRVGQEERVR